jgi:hypothetical protein
MYGSSMGYGGMGSSYGGMGYGGSSMLGGGGMLGGGYGGMGSMGNQYGGGMSGMGGYNTNNMGYGGANSMPYGQQQQQQPIRESQVASGVAFLQHADVVTQPLSTRVTFLEQKQLNTAEIAEAFRRCDPASPAVAALDAAVRSGQAASVAVRHLASDTTPPPPPSSSSSSSSSPQTAGANPLSAPTNSRGADPAAAAHAAAIALSAPTPYQPSPSAPAPYVVQLGHFV